MIQCTLVLSATRPPITRWGVVFFSSNIFVSNWWKSFLFILFSGTLSIKDCQQLFHRRLFLRDVSQGEFKKNRKPGTSKEDCWLRLCKMKVWLIECGGWIGDGGWIGGGGWIGDGGWIKGSEWMILSSHLGYVVCCQPQCYSRYRKWHVNGFLSFTFNVMWVWLSELSMARKAILTMLSGGMFGRSIARAVELAAMNIRTTWKHKIFSGHSHT